MPDITITDWTKLGSSIRAERRRASLTQSELAGLAGTSRSWLARIEAGHRGAELEQLLRVLNALGLNLVLRTARESAEPTPSDDPAETAGGEASEDITPSRHALPSRQTAWRQAADRQADFAWGNDLVPPMAKSADGDQSQARNHGDG